MKTKEQLMAPRYRVIAGYPRSQFPVGTILESLANATTPIFSLPNWKPGVPDISAEEIEMYPHLFQPAHWSDNRLPDEFPAYVICDGKVEKVLEVKTDEAGFVSKIVTDDYPQFFSADIFQEPATEEEYEAYKKANP